MSVRLRNVEQVSNDPAATKTVDADSGIQSVRGSQRVGDGIITSVQAAYSNLMYHPIAAVLLILGLFILVAEVHSHDGPLEIAVQALTKYIKDEHHPGWLRNIAYQLIQLISAVIKHKVLFATLALIWFTPASKPSSRTITFAIILTLLVMYFKDFTVLEIFILSQLFFLFITLRTPSHKAVVFFLFALLFFSDTGNLRKFADGNTYLNSLGDAKLDELERRSIDAYEKAHYSTTHSQPTKYDPSKHPHPPHAGSKGVFTPSTTPRPPNPSTKGSKGSSSSSG